MKYIVGLLFILSTFFASGQASITKDQWKPDYVSITKCLKQGDTKTPDFLVTIPNIIMDENFVTIGNTRFEISSVIIIDRGHLQINTRTGDVLYYYESSRLSNGIPILRILEWKGYAAWSKKLQ